ncbi:MAG: thiamine pyrophosphate-dependent enzyme [Pseudomonadota bacterium]
MDRAEVVHDNFLSRVKTGDLPVSANSPTLEEAGMSPQILLAVFRAQVLSRQLDRVSRKLQARGEGYYTIGSSGHEGSAAIAAALRVSDPAFLHYRDAAFQLARSAQLTGQTPLWDMLLSFTTSAEDPISGGRHKVLGSRILNIPPQTSTIASHLPKAVGAAYSIDLSRRLSPEHQQYPDDAIVYCSFGDASLNHSTAQGALNAAGWSTYRYAPLPLLFVCQDNGIGISVKTPAGWVRDSLAHRPGLAFAACNGLDVVATYAATARLAQQIRHSRKPAVLHMSCVRLYGHAGADMQQAYLSPAEIEAAEALDPLLHTARRLIDEGLYSPEDVLDLYLETEGRVERAAEDAIARPKLRTATEVMSSIVPPARPVSCAPLPEQSVREAVFGGPDMRAVEQPQHMAKLINFTLTDLMLQHREILLFGEDVGRKGGVYGVTQKLHGRFGAHRVVDTLLDEQTILGLAVGLGQNGFVPVPEIQFLAYLHNAEDQLRGEAATLPFFSNGQFTNPMVVRIAGLGYQRGFGGHFHNDNSLAVLRDIPGLIVACPSNGRDAALMLREAVRLAREEQRVVVFVEPIALYMTRDLHEEGDGGWMHVYPAPGRESVKLGEVNVIGEGKDLAIVSYANGFFLSLKARKVLKEKHGLDARVIDMRWIAPLQKASLLEATAPCECVLIVDECRRSGSQSEALMALFSEHSEQAAARIAAHDSFIATGPAYASTLPSRDGIVTAALRLCRDDESLERGSS